MKLILTEKPSVARDIAKALGGGKPKDGYIEAGEYVITWAMGHLLEIDDSIAPQKWELESLPIFPERFSYRVKGQAQANPKLFKCSECGALVWKEFMGKKISSKDAIKLLEGKEVLLKGLKVRLKNGRLKIVGF